MIKIYDMLLRYCALALASAALLMGCSSNEIDQTFKPTGDKFTIVARSASPTRVALNDNSDQSQIEVTWSAEDSFTLFDSTGTFVGHFVQSGEQGYTSSEFISSDIYSLTDGESYTAIYPYVEGDELRTLTDRLAINIGAMEQSGNQNLDHLRSAMRMRSEFTYSQTAEPLAIQFTHDYAILKLTYSLDGWDTPQKLLFSDNDTEYTLTYNYDNVDYGDGYIDNDSYTSYLVFDPAEDASSHELNFCVYTYGNAQKNYTTTVSKRLYAGRCYTATIPYFTTKVMYSLANFSADYYPTDTDTWTISDTTADTTDFAGLSAAIAALNDSGRQISLEFPNLEAIPNYAIFGENETNWEYLSAALHSVSADVATSVGYYAFFSCQNLASVELPAATYINGCAFQNCSDLASAEISAVIEIGDNAFRGCSLTSVEIPTATNINSYAFNSCSALTYVYMPEVVTIGYSAFANCSALTSLDIPSTVTTIGGGAFNTCQSLTELNFNAQNYIFEDGVIYSSDKRTVISALYALVSGDIYDANITEIAANAYSGCTNITSVEFPSVTTINNSAFYSCNSITSAEFATARTVGGNAFQSCQAITSFYLPEATIIEHDAFWDCSALETISLPKAESFGTYAFDDCSNLTTINLPSATEFANYVFDDCSSLTSLSIATNEGTVINSISDLAFSGTSVPANISLTLGSANSQFVSGNTLTFGNFSAEFKEIIITSGGGDIENAHEIDLSIFGDTIYDVDNSAEHNGVTYVYNGSYYNTDSQTVITSPNGYIYNTTELIGLEKICVIEDYAYYNYTLTAGASPAISSEIEYTKEGDTYTYYIPSDCKFFCLRNNSKYNATADRIILYYDSLGDTTTADPVEPFSRLADFSTTDFPTDNNTWTITDTTATTTDFAGLSAAIAALNESGRQISLEFPNLEAIPEYALFGTTEIDWYYPSAALVSVSANVATSIGNHAFLNRDGLTHVEFASAKVIDYEAFLDCSALTSVYLPEATNIGDNAFQDCNLLSYIEIPKITEIGDGVFIGCNTLATLDIPSTVTTIGGGAFSSCDNLTVLNLYAPNFIYEDGIVYNSDKSTIISALKAVVTGDFSSNTVTSVESYAFHTCNALTSIELPAATNIGGCAFYECYNVTSIRLPAATAINYMTFAECYDLTSVELATADNTVLSSIFFSAFTNTPTENITLTLGSANNQFVSGNTLTVGDFSAVFKEIILQ